MQPSAVLERLRLIEGIMFDLDGCLVISNGPSGDDGRALPGAIELLSQVRASGRRLCAFTNGTAQGSRAVAAHLRSMGLDLADHEVLTPANVAARVIAERYGDAPVLVFGGEGITEDFRARGVTLVDHEASGSGGETGAVAVVVGWDPDFTRAKIQFAAEAILAGAALYCTSDAPAFASNARLNVGVSGFIAAGLSHVTGAPWTVLGKPSPYALEDVCRTLGTNPATTLVFGDDVYLESVMARRGGALAGIVLTGTATRQQLADTPAADAPDFVVESLDDLGRMLAASDALRGSTVS
jgi:HAD superfamily hydrolase (TIGR01450 family)